MSRKFADSETTQATPPLAVSGPKPAGSDAAWTARRRAIASLLIAALLAIVFCGPLTNPVATEELTGPIGRWLAPVHQALYLSHGYRFFAPDPGPSHLLVYRLHYPEGEVRERRFPDSSKTSPRLRYHRWFMLSETLYAEHASQPDRQSYARLQADLEQQADRFARAGQSRLAAEVKKSAARQRLAYERATRRIAGLVQAVGRVLIEDTGATRVELFSQERLIPLPGEVVLGRKLADPAGLLPPIKIGAVLADGTFIPPLAEPAGGAAALAPQPMPIRGADQ